MVGNFHIPVLGSLRLALRHCHGCAIPDSMLSGYMALCQAPSRFITRLNDRLYRWGRCRLAMRRTNIGVPHQVISLYRSCHEKPRTTRIYVIIHRPTTRLLNLNSGAAFKWYLCQRLNSYLRIEITPVERVVITSLIALFPGATCHI